MNTAVSFALAMIAILIAGIGVAEPLWAAPPRKGDSAHADKASLDPHPARDDALQERTINNEFGSSLSIAAENFDSHTLRGSQAALVDSMFVLSAE